MKWLEELKKLPDKDPGLDCLCWDFLWDHYELDRLIEIVEITAVGDHCCCNVCGVEYPDEVGHKPTCPCSEGWGE